jgi:hypothetical protein
MISALASALLPIGMNGRFRLARSNKVAFGGFFV